MTHEWRTGTVASAGEDIYYEVIGDTTRTFAVTMAVGDPSGDLRSGMMADVVLKCDLGAGLALVSLVIAATVLRRERAAEVEVGIEAEEIPA